jgi:hypothetical protein
MDNCLLVMSMGGVPDLRPCERSELLQVRVTGSLSIPCARDYIM